MSNEGSNELSDSLQLNDSTLEQPQNAEEEQELESDTDSDESSDDDYLEAEEGDTDTLTYTRPGDELPESENTPETNIKMFKRVLESKRMKRMQEGEDRDYVFYEDLFDFPEDPERWMEEDLQELWADAPLEMSKPGWDPVWANEEDWDVVNEEIKAGRDPPIAPFYVPYRKPYPPIPDNHYDISNPKAVIEELDRIEEFLQWVSYIFPDGSSYEGTVWDDLTCARYPGFMEKGRYRYAGQWKHSRMHGCGVYEVNERTIYGRFYFGELLQDSHGCDEDISAMHAGIAEVAAAKARMFVNKPDGSMYSALQYLFLRRMTVLRYAKNWMIGDAKMHPEICPSDETPEFVLINKEPEPDPTDPSKLIYTEDPLILHTKSGRLINYIDDEKYGVRLFWQPPLREGEIVDPGKAEFLPLGFDEFYGREVIEKKENVLKRLVLAMENACKPLFDKIEKWSEEKKKGSEIKMKLIEKELDLIEAELCLEEAIDDMDEELRQREKEEEKKMDMDASEVNDVSMLTDKDKKVVAQEEEEEEEDDEGEEDDDVAPSSFGSVSADEYQVKNDQKGGKPRDFPFSSSSLSFASCSLISLVPSRLQESFLSRRQIRLPGKETCVSHIQVSNNLWKPVDSVSYRPMLGQRRSLKTTRQVQKRVQVKNCPNRRKSQIHSLSRILSHSSAPISSPKRNSKSPRTENDCWLHAAPEFDLDRILSLHTPTHYLESYTDTSVC
ncbi:protein TIC 100 [Carica papaya]|uniref:protein TIC 100 n=1 Tax=Carica papaya TaxID=3649 RepID=UPI000B8C9FBD|nr:protein TIC 100 [Carica papaya]